MKEYREIQSLLTDIQKKIKKLRNRQEKIGLLPTEQELLYDYLSRYNHLHAKFMRLKAKIDNLEAAWA